MFGLMKKFAHLNWALLDQALVSGTNFLVGILLVRYLGFEQYGQFVLVWMVVQFIVSMQSALIVSPMVSIAPTVPATERGAYYDATLALQAGLTLSVAGLATIGAFLSDSYRPEWLDVGVIIPLIGCLVFVQLQDYCRRNLFSRLFSHRAFYLDILAYGAQLPLIFLVIRSNPSLQNALSVILVAMVVSVLLGYSWMESKSVPLIDTRQVLHRHWISSKWLLGAAILQWVSGNYFLIVAGAVFGPTMVGAIRAAQNLLGLTHILFQGLENIVPSEASRRYQRLGPAALSSYLSKTVLVMLLVTGTVATLAALFSGPLLRIAYGELNPDSIIAMAWYVPFYTLAAVILPLRAGLRSLEKTRPIFIAQFTCAMFSLLTAHYLINQYGIHGVMGGMLLELVITTTVLVTSLGRALRA